MRLFSFANAVEIVAPPQPVRLNSPPTIWFDPVARTIFRRDRGVTHTLTPAQTERLLVMWTDAAVNDCERRDEQGVRRHSILAAECAAALEARFEAMGFEPDPRDAA